MKYSIVEGLIDRDGNGEFLLTAKALALIFGVPEAQVHDRVGKSGASQSPGQAFSARLPYIWLQNGRRRIREAFAVIGDEDMASALVYLDRLEGGGS